MIEHICKGQRLIINKIYPDDFDAEAFVNLP